MKNKRVPKRKSASKIESGKGAGQDDNRDVPAKKKEANRDLAELYNGQICI